MVPCGVRRRAGRSVQPAGADTRFRAGRLPGPFTSLGPGEGRPGFQAPRPAGGGEILKPGETLGRSKPVGEDPAPAAAEDAALVARARAGDERAFGELVERYRDRVYGLALRVVRSPADAEEVAQDAFVRAWLALRGFRGEASFSTWLYRIAVRRAFDRALSLRTRRGRETGLEAAEHAAAPAGEGAAPAMRRLERLIDELSPAQRAAVTLYYLEDQSVERVAEVLEMPENTVKTHLSRARAALRSAWIARE